MIHVYVTEPGQKTRARVYDIPSTVIIGRASPCGCRLEHDPLVSRCHAVLSIHQDRITIRDLDSLNGLIINGAHYGGPSSHSLQQPQKLADGDTIVIGETVLTMSISQPRVIRAEESTQGKKRSTRVRKRTSPVRRASAIPGYLIESIIGAGGMGVVYQARELSSGRKVAIKTMHSDIASNKRALQHFCREIEVTKRINHPNIIAYLNSGVTPDSLLYLVLEFADGGDLSKLLDKHGGKLDPATVLSFATQIADGLAHMHSMGIIHRDIKPKNILLTSDPSPTVKISDLGLASQEDETTLSGCSSGGGTVAYMPPEQLTKSRPVGPSGDVFSVGATMYEMLCGRRPYDFSRCDRREAVSQGLIMPLARIGVPVHPGLSAIVDKCIAPRPEDRYQHCGELLAALKNVHVIPTPKPTRSRRYKAGNTAASAPLAVHGSHAQ